MNETHECRRLGWTHAIARINLAMLAAGAAKQKYALRLGRPTFTARAYLLPRQSLQVSEVAEKSPLG
jgi:hypothetical protein